jgi:anti-anti-sigma regulatory factor
VAAAREPVVVDVSGLDDDVGSTGGGLAAIAALARLRLAARRTGHRVRLKGAGPGLRDLLELSGLAGEFEWEPEEGEEAPGVQK